jgi:hypothetical protein
MPGLGLLKSESSGLCLFQWPRDRDFAAIQVNIVPAEREQFATSLPIKARDMRQGKPPICPSGACLRGFATTDNKKLELVN